MESDACSAPGRASAPRLRRGRQVILLVKMSLVQAMECPAQGGGGGLCRADRPQDWSLSSSRWEQEVQDSR